MSQDKPILFAIDDDPQVLRAIRSDLRQRYKDEYRIVSTSNPTEARESLVELKNKNAEIALFLSDQRMPELDGVAFLSEARKVFPKAKRALLTAYSDTQAAIEAINKVQLDHYLMKPWDPPEEKLFPVIDDLLEDWMAGYRPKFQGLRIIGYQYSQLSHQLKDYLAGNLFPYRWMDIEKEEEARILMEENALNLEDLPALILEDGEILKHPEKSEVAARLGLPTEAKAELYDTVIIGAGPAGLAAAVYGASEGLKTLMLEKHAPGGQAGTSSRIENYLGFPNGLSGADLARRALSQASRLGAEFLTPAQVNSIELADQQKILKLENGKEILTKSLVIASGVNYRQLDTPGLQALTGKGVYYGAASTEASACSNRTVFIVGGGNSAGQAAMYLSRFAKQVKILIRRADLVDTMSAYLIEQIHATSNIQVCPFSEITEALGTESLNALRIRDNRSGEIREEEGAALFIFIGAKPATDWLPTEILKDEKGFIITGTAVLESAKGPQQWKRERIPYSLETSIPGVFAAGDVRSGAMNRVASAVGEGAMSISYTHRYLTEI
ncbi:FAD-dependent oxidoreductase [Croceimicrobium sp.]|uniref:FAD-dependent oxidoreductase n=1 Tax=Croceimicrobium sp. TaxID=2828340 RepID=UPI003BACF504